MSEYTFELLSYFALWVSVVLCVAVRAKVRSFEKKKLREERELLKWQIELEKKASEIETRRHYPSYK